MHREGLVLRCAGKVGNPFQTNHGSRPSSGNQEGRSGSDEVVPAVSPFSPCLQSFPASGSFPMNQFFTSGDQSIGSSQSILKELSPEYSLEGLMLKLKLQYFGHLMRRADSLEKTLMLGKIDNDLE